MRIFFLIFQANLRNQEIVYPIILQKNIIKLGDSNYVETFKDCIRMALVFADFKISKKCTVMWVII